MSPVYARFTCPYKIRGAEAQVESRQAELQDIERQTLLELVQAHADATAALGNLQASEALFAAAREAQAVTQRKFDQGAADMLEILNIQAALAEARQERIRCQMDWRSACLRLLAHTRVMGRGRREAATSGTDGALAAAAKVVPVRRGAGCVNRARPNLWGGWGGNDSGLPDCTKGSPAGCLVSCRILLRGGGCALASMACP